MKRAYFYTNHFHDFQYASDHPMRPLRLKETYELSQSFNLFSTPQVEVIEPKKADIKDLTLFHTLDYLQALENIDKGDLSKGYFYGLGAGDNPATPGLYEWSLYTTGASVDGARLLLSGVYDRVFNIGGGLHHAMKDRASGFCYINDPVVAIAVLRKAGKRVMYIDIDAHHGDGVERAFYDTKDVLTLSIHESGRYLFPGTGFAKDVGTGEGEGYAVNIPLPPNAGDQTFLKAFKETVPDFIEAFKPDVIVLQLGADGLKNDPITHLQLTTNSFETAIKDICSFNIPILAMGGGGYNIDNVKRVWTLAWAGLSNATEDKEINEKLNSIRDEKQEESQEEKCVKEKDLEVTLSSIDFVLNNQLEKIKKDRV